MIRKSTANDYKRIVLAIQNKNIPFITAANVKNDIENQNQYVIEKEGKIIAILSLVYDTKYNYYALKRLCVLNKKNNGRGYAQTIVRYVMNEAPGKVGCTPWADNSAMRHLLEKLGFKMEYIFNEVWCFYSRE